MADTERTHVGEDDLPLQWATPRAWAGAVLADECALLADHAQLERAAARNALTLMSRAPRGADVGRWAERLTGVARDEVAHLGTVLRELRERGGALPRGHANPYARDLHGLVRTGEGERELADRLLVAGLIELRSYERFGLLAAEDHELAPLYRGLQASEMGHYRLFLTLAGQVLDDEEVGARWAELLDAEAGIAERQEPGPRMHSGQPR